MPQRHVPERTCVGCRTTRPKRELVRVVRTPEGAVELDPTGKRSGRGAYLCRNMECLEKAVRGKGLERALRHPVEAEVLERVRAALQEVTW
ncbi:RNase P modulator RnpM [Limnochorda pilosa]|uniref:YlxR domain-containing protein n=1 Tax=Limnochorda pilosa TaxID=1555112 RepID=A0A0K2SKB3_LIMPI|nr:YlxR family protein [Limnochorda pilosa]BAS27535.1 hypothetical protein LIP_1689 [Limnochorda pilosa]